MLDEMPSDLLIDDLLPLCNFDENQTNSTISDESLLDLNDINWTNSYLTDFLVSDEFLNQQLDNFLSSNYITPSDNDINNNQPNLDPEGYSVLGVNLNLSCNSIQEPLINNDDNSPNWSKFDDEFIFNDCLIDYQNNEIISKPEIELSTQINLQTRESLDLINMFPHIADERNLKRRALLYENPINMENSKKPKMINDINKKSPSSSSLSSINGYRERKTSEEKHFPCSITNCDKVYSKPSHLRAHLKRHSGEKPFVCNWQNCTWKFSRSDELARHRRSHLGIKPYKCELCERAFSRSDHLAKHNKVHKKKLAQFGTYHIRKRIR